MTISPTSRAPLFLRGDHILLAFRLMYVCRNHRDDERFGNPKFSIQRIRAALLHTFGERHDAEEMECNLGNWSGSLPMQLILDNIPALSATRFNVASLEEMTSYSDSNAGIRPVLERIASGALTAQDFMEQPMIEHTQCEPLLIRGDQLLLALDVLAAVCGSEESTHTSGIDLARAKSAISRVLTTEEHWLTALMHGQRMLSIDEFELRALLRTGAASLTQVTFDGHALWANDDPDALPAHERAAQQASRGALKQYLTAFASGALTTQDVRIEE
ncbi:hypothetical protein HY632_04475 [Candidatus Uhrbacteria bacterium]|nr:hypothetical protein [Candidatus Uhrbacteria bacterium]